MKTATAPNPTPEGKLLSLAGHRAANRRKSPGTMDDLRHVVAPAKDHEWRTRWRKMLADYHHRLHGHVHRLLGKHAAAALVDSLVLEAVSEYQNWEYRFAEKTGRVPEEPWGPLALRARNRVIDWRRRHGKTDPIDGDDVGPLLVTPAPAGFEHAWIHDRFEAFATVHPQCAEVSWAYFVEGSTLAEIGDRFCTDDSGPTPGSNALINRAKRLIARAQQRLADFVRRG